MPLYLKKVLPREHFQISCFVKHLWRVVSEKDFMLIIITRNSCEIYRAEALRDYSFSMYTKFSEKPIFLSGDKKC